MEQRILLMPPTEVGKLKGWNDLKCTLRVQGSWLTAILTGARLNKFPILQFVGYWDRWRLTRLTSKIWEELSNLYNKTAGMIDTSALKRLSNLSYRRWNSATVAKNFSMTYAISFTQLGSLWSLLVLSVDDWMTVMLNLFCYKRR